MQKLKFYNVVTKNSFETDKYELRVIETSKGIKYFAVATTPKNQECWRVVSKEFYEKS